MGSFTPFTDIEAAIEEAIFLYERRGVHAEVIQISGAIMKVVFDNNKKSNNPMWTTKNLKTEKFREIKKGKKSFFVQNDNSVYIAYDKCWIAGCYADMKAANMAFKVNPEVLESLQDRGGIITETDLKLAQSEGHL